MEIEFEILAILSTAFLFTIAGLVLEDYKKIITFKLLAAIAWFSLALSFTASLPSFLAFSILFMGIGIAFILLAMQDVLALFSDNKKAKDLWWKE